MGSGALVGGGVALGSAGVGGLGMDWEVGRARYICRQRRRLPKPITPQQKQRNQEQNNWKANSQGTHVIIIHILLLLQNRSGQSSRYLICHSDFNLLEYSHQTFNRGNCFTNLRVPE